MKLFQILLSGMLLVSVSANAAGSFYLDKVNGRDCLIDPDGKPFLSLGICHIQDVIQGNFQGDIHEACDEAYDNLMAWGYNTGGYGTPEPLAKRIPYMAPMYLTKNANYMSDEEFFYPDVFDPSVQEGIKEIIRYEIGKNQGNPNLIGYYWTDTPQWDMERARKKRGTDWVSTIRSLPNSTPGKKRYKQFLEEGGESDYDFLRIIARELYRVLGEETKRHAPGVLIFGERYLFDDHPDCVVKEALPYIDVLSIQPGSPNFRESYFEELHQKFDIPIMLCDHQTSFPTPEYPKTMWHQMESEEASGLAYAQYLKDAFKKPYILGYHRCQYIDRFEKYLGILKQGMLRGDRTPYETLAEHVAEANADAIDRFREQIDR